MSPLKSGPNREATESFFAKVQERQNAWGSHGIPRASSIGNDLRQQYFGLMYSKQQKPRDAGEAFNMLPAPEPISGESLWGMSAGNRQEEPIYEVLREQGYLVRDVQSGYVRYQDTDGAIQVKFAKDDDRMADVVAALKRNGDRPFLTGHIDGIIEKGPDDIPPTLLELKMATMFSFGGMVQHGVMSDKPVYRLQATANAGSFGLPFVRMMIFSRDKSATEWYFHKMRSSNPINENAALYVEDMQIDPRWLQMADFRALHLLDCVEKGELPESDPGISPLNVRMEKNGELTTLFPCGWCEWKEPCLQAMHKQGVNINDFTVMDDLRSKKDKEATPV